MGGKKESIPIKRKVPLKKHTTFQVGGLADYFIIVQKKEDLIKGIEKARKKNLSFFVLGGGSNILFSDKGYKGIILKIEIKKINVKKEKRIIVGAGAGLGKTVSFCAAHGFSGLEWAAGIPGTVGGAIRGNAGAFGKSIKDSLISVKAYNIEKGKVEKFKKKDCFFGYRESFFKKEKNYIILEAEMGFQEKKSFLISKEIKEFLAQRKEKQPQGFSAGSVFKNYETKSQKEKENILKDYPEIKKTVKGNTIPAAFLIDKCGLKGKMSGRAMISKIHANFIVNLDQAKSSDIKKLMILIQKEVYKKFKVVLEEEIMIVEN